MNFHCSQLCSQQVLSQSCSKFILVDNNRTKIDAIKANNDVYCLHIDTNFAYWYFFAIGSLYKDTRHVDDKSNIDMILKRLSEIYI